MSMGYGAGYADVISEYKIKKVCLAEYRAFLKELKKWNVELEDFAKHLAQDLELSLDYADIDETNEITDKIKERYEALQTAFHKKSGGLHLDISFHNSDDNGSNYDEVNGAFFCVGGMYQLTPAGKKFERSVKRKFFVTFG